MCIGSAPKQQAAPLPPKSETVDTAGNVAANRDAEQRRKRFAMSRMSTQGAGAMQGDQATATKTKLGE